MSLSELIGHQLVLVSLLLTRVQLLGQDQQSLLLALQLALADHKLYFKTVRMGDEDDDDDGGGIAGALKQGMSTGI